MKNALFLLFFIFFSFQIFGQHIDLHSDTVPNSYFITHTKTEYLKKLADLPCGIKENDSVKIILRKLEVYLIKFQPDEKYRDDIYAKASNLQALKSVKEGGYGIGAVLIDSAGRIIAEGHNSQIQRKRSDLHAEMTLLSDFEDSKNAYDYLNIFVYKPGMTVFSTAEPCPMCFIRLSAAGVDTKYCTPGPEDGMVSHVSCLPSSWRNLAAKRKCEKGKCSPVMQKISHLLFFSFLLDNRGPK